MYTFMYILFIFVYFLPFIICQSDTDIIKTAVNISQSTYCVIDNNFDCKTCSRSNIYEKIYSNKGELAIYGYNTKYKMNFIGFRGSSNIKNWITNIQFDIIYPYGESIGIEKGFYNLFCSLKNDIYNDINLLVDKNNNNNIIITGHSLGGAISTLLSFDVLYNNLPYNVYLITFGSPRVGNKNFVEYFNKYKIYSKRITHYYDIVPHLPQSFLNYQHIPNEIWYNLDNSYYQECDDSENEDISCSNSCAPTQCTSIDQHLYYMNLTMGINGC